MYETDSERDAAIRSYAAGETSWAQLQRNGFENFLDVLQRLRTGSAPADSSAGRPHR